MVIGLCSEELDDELLLGAIGKDVLCLLKYQKLRTRGKKLPSSTTALKSVFNAIQNDPMEEHRIMLLAIYY